MRAGPSQEEIRRHNLGTLLRYVHVHGATSRAELTNRLGLNRSTIGALTAELTTAGLVSEAAPRETGRAGRPSLVVRPESSKVYAYALSIEVDRLRAARVGLGGQILVRRVDGMVRLAPTIGWVEEPVGAALRTELGDAGKLTVGNHADVSALVEH